MYHRRFYSYSTLQIDRLWALEQIVYLFQSVRQSTTNHCRRRLDFAHGSCRSVFDSVDDEQQRDELRPSLDAFVPNGDDYRKRRMRENISSLVSFLTQDQLQRLDRGFHSLRSRSVRWLSSRSSSLVFDRFVVVVHAPVSRPCLPFSPSTQQFAKQKQNKEENYSARSSWSLYLLQNVVGQFVSFSIFIGPPSSFASTNVLDHCCSIRWMLVRLIRREQCFEVSLIRRIDTWIRS